MGLAIDPALFPGDGGVYDIRILNARLADWRAIFRSLPSAPWTVELEHLDEYSVDDLNAMSDAEFRRVLFEVPGDEPSPVLRFIDPDGIALSCFFAEIEAFELSFHPWTVETADDIRFLGDVIVWLAHASQRRVGFVMMSGPPIKAEWAFASYVPDGALETSDEWVR